MKQIEPMEYDYIKAASAQDCTGLIPSAIKNASEIESYEEIYPFLPQLKKYSQIRDNNLPENKIFRPDDHTSEPES